MIYDKELDEMEIPNRNERQQLQSLLQIHCDNNF